MSNDPKTSPDGVLPSGKAPDTPSATAGMDAALQAWGPLGEYLVDAAQRTILFWDLLRRRSDQYQEQKAKDRAPCAQLRRRIGTRRPDL